MELINDTELNDSVPSNFTDFQDSLIHFAPSSDHDVDDKTLGKLLAEVHRDYADYRCPEGVSVSPSSMSVMVDRTGKPVERSDIDHFGFSVRNVYSAQNHFPVITQADRMVDLTGKPVEEINGIAEERESSSAQIRTLFNEQRRTIIAERCEKVSHHEHQAARRQDKRREKIHFQCDGAWPFIVGGVNRLVNFVDDRDLWLLFDYRIYCSECP